MKRTFKKTVALFLAVVLTVIGSGLMIASAASTSELQQKINQLEKESQKLEAEIKRLNNEKASQQKIVNAYQAKINNTQAQIIACNNEISRISNQIAANKTEINKRNAEMEADKLAFKKSLRAIVMSNTGSTVQILLGADSLADYLQLSQLTNAISAKNKVLIERITENIKYLEAKNAQNEELLAQQSKIKETVVAKQKELLKEQQKISAVVSSLNNQATATSKANKNIEKEIANYKAEIERQAFQPSVVRGANSKGYIWPVPGYYHVSCEFGTRNGLYDPKKGHSGMDISGGGIAGKPVVAIDDGTVTYVKSNWKSSDGISGLNSYGNYVTIQHDNYQGQTVKVFYAHLMSVAVRNGQEVKQGQTIGYVGTTGHSTGYHLHIQLQLNETNKNPRLLIG